MLYIVAQLNQPKRFDWTPTLRNNDKNPFGAFIPYTELKQLFSTAHIQSHKIPLYNVLHKSIENESAYILLEPEFKPGKVDLEELLKYVQKGRSTIDGFFNEIKKKDSTVVLGITEDSMPDFVKVRFGEGFFLLHAAPLCFSNYFMLYQNNHDYLSKALSYISPTVTILHWDEFYKTGREGSNTPLRFFLSNTFLRWALWLTIAAFVIFVLFEMKRRQRIIPVIEPLRNTTVDFVETVSSVYYSQHDNNSIARKKIQFWFDYIRQRYYLSTQNTDDTFVQQLQRKSGVSKELIELILKNIRRAEAQPQITDDLLAELSNRIDEFYQLSKHEI